MKDFDIFKATSYVAAILLTYILALLIVSFIADGWIYRVEQPVPARIEGEEVVLTFERYSLLPMVVKSYRELNCDPFVHSYIPIEHTAEPGHAQFEWRYKIPTSDNAGPCFISGILKYDPLGRLGPRLTYYWKSEEFILPK
jgi:hypothetical protein